MWTIPLEKKGRYDELLFFALLIQRNAIWGPLFFYPRSYIVCEILQTDAFSFEPIHPKDKDVFVYYDKTLSFVVFFNQDTYDGISCQDSF